MKSNLKVAIYTRVSTTHQIDKDSLPHQKNELINYSKYALNINEYTVFEDAGYSGKNTDRPQYQNMIERVHNGEFSHLLVWKIDRISRNLKDFTELYDDLKECNVTFISKNEQFDTSSAMGEAMLKIILVFAELERKLTAERVFSIMLSRAEKGLWNGATVPLGYKWSKELKFPVIDPVESVTVSEVFNLYEIFQSTVRVANKLNENNYKTKRDGTWVPKTVHGILTNPFYIGTYRYNVKTGGNRRWKDKKEWIVKENNHPGIISKEQYLRVQEILENNKTWKSDFQRSNMHTHIFSKLIYCSDCGKHFTAGLDRKRADGYQPSRYYCTTTNNFTTERKCKNYISDIVLVPFILTYLANFINLNNRITKKHSLRDIEAILLRGHPLRDIRSIDKKCLVDLKTIFTAYEDYDFTDHNTSLTKSLNEKKYDLELSKQKKALSRLEELFLYSEDSIPKKDYLLKRNEINNLIEELQTQLDKLPSSHQQVDNKSFIDTASKFILKDILVNNINTNWKELLTFIDSDSIKDFINFTVDSIHVKNNLIQSISFKNGIIHTFTYKTPADRVNMPEIKLIYKDSKETMINYLNKHKAFTRKELQELTGLKKHGAYELINELINENVIEKQGQSISTLYVIK